jgi:amino acid transporter
MRPAERRRKELCEWLRRLGLADRSKLEFSLKRPRFLATCMYGIPFIVLGNLAGNALALGRYVLLAAGHEVASPGYDILIAIAALSFVILIHMCTRRGGIFLNNLFAVLKVILLLAIIVIGLTFRGDGLKVKDHLGGQNYSSPTNFADRPRSLAGYTQSLLSVMYTYSGYEQPFYVSALFWMRRL